MNLRGFLFSAYPVLPSQLRKCLNIAKSGISTVVNPVDQRGVWVFFFPRGNWFTGCENTLPHRLTAQPGTDADRLLDWADVKLQGTWPRGASRSAQVCHPRMTWDPCLIIYNSKCVFLNFGKWSVFIQALSRKVKSKQEPGRPSWRGLSSWSFAQWEPRRCRELNPQPRFSWHFPTFSPSLSPLELITIIAHHFKALELLKGVMNMISSALQIAVACLLMSAQDTGLFAGSQGLISSVQNSQGLPGMCVAHRRFSVLVSLGLQQ